ncbi:MAG: MFS transporter [Lachnospiraceae bacterium]|nr:MFS transporter [Lachnospiraceae bacterium]
MEKAKKESKFRKFMETRGALALPGPAGNLGSILIHNVLLKYYTDVLGVEAKYIGWILIIYNIWNAINDPWFGVLIDKRKYDPKKGKYVYLMRVTAPVLIIAVAGMMFAQPSWGEIPILIALLLELVIFDTAFTVYNISYNSFFLIAAPSTEERVQTEVVRTYIGNVFGFLVTLIPTFLLVGQINRNLIYVAFVISLVASSFMLYLALTKLKDNEAYYENVIFEEHSDRKTIMRETWKIMTNKTFLLWFLFLITTRATVGYYFTPFTYYIDKVIGTDGLGATLADVVPGVLMLLALPFISSIINKKGSKTTLLLNYIPTILGFAILWFTTNIVMTTIAYVLIVLSYNVNQTACVSIGGALIDEDEMITGVRKTGLINGIFAFFTTILTSSQEFVFTNILSAFNYDANAVTEYAKLGIRIGTALVPIGFCILGFIPLLLFPIGKKREKELSDFSKNARRGENA